MQFEECRTSSLTNSPTLLFFVLCDCVASDRIFFTNANWLITTGTCTRVLTIFFATAMHINRSGSMHRYKQVIKS